LKKAVKELTLAQGEARSEGYRERLKPFFSIADGHGDVEINARGVMQYFSGDWADGTGTDEELERLCSDLTCIRS